VIPRFNDQTVEELIDSDPSYVIWLYESGDDSVSLEQYGAAIDSLEHQSDYRDYE
jgi:hypothetical protein